MLQTEIKGELILDIKTGILSVRGKTIEEERALLKVYQSKLKEASQKNFNLTLFFDLFQEFSCDRIGVANNGGTDSISAFLGWYKKNKK